jgi:hypothetical protein
MARSIHFTAKLACRSSLFLGTARRTVAIVRREATFPKVQTFALGDGFAWMFRDLAPI